MAEAFELVGEANRGEVPGAERLRLWRRCSALVGLSSLTQPDEGAEADDEAEKLLDGAAGGAGG